MRRPVLAMVLGAAFLLCGLRSGAQADVDVHVNLGFPLPPVIHFTHEPELVLVPQTDVYYVPGPSYDLYRQGEYWYLNQNGYWYRASSYRGPFSAVVYADVPHVIIAAPARYHSHPVRVGHRHDGHGNGHGKGHGKHGHD